MLKELVQHLFPVACMVRVQISTFTIFSRLFADFNVGNYNFLHVLSVNPDGTLGEPDELMQLPVQNTVRPRGVAVYKVN